MDNTERHMRYLETYRQQLRRETDAMGYGQPQGYRPNFESQTRAKSTPPWAITAIALMVLGLVSA